MGSNMYKFALLAVVGAFGVFSAQAQYMSTFAGTGSPGYAGDGGQASNAKLNAMTGMAVDGIGNIYIADNENNVVRRVDVTGTITTFAGTGVAGYTGGGGLATAARLNRPMAVATDATGNVYISDNGNHVIRKVDMFGVISDFAGTGTPGYSGDGDDASLAQLAQPQGLSITTSGDLYIADVGNNVVRKIDNSTHQITTVAGTGAPGSGGDGGMATNARLGSPSSIAVDASGNIFIADVLNHKVRKVDGATGMIATYAGTGVPGNSGDGGAATAALMTYPTGVSLDVAGNLYIAEQGNHNVRMVSTSGSISHVAGTSVSGYNGDGGLATDAQLASPKFVFVDGWNRVYIGDYGNNVIRKIVATASVTTNELQSGFSIYPVPAKNEAHINLAGLVGAKTIQVSDIVGRVVSTEAVTNTVHTLNTAKLLPGVYVITVVTTDNNYTKRLVVE